jgi:CRP-like cAMP-binding protein
MKNDDPLKNHLLSALPADEFQRIKPKLESVDCKLAQVLYESGDRLEHAYFPTTAIISMLYVMQNGSTAEIGVVGNDGVLGNAMILGGDTTTSRAVVQSAGSAFKMKREDLTDEFKRGGVFQDIMLRYTQALMTQISQTAVCNRLHSIDQQFARWLLISHDRLANDKLVMTHDLISNMLGVRREGITIAAQKTTAAPSRSSTAAASNAPSANATASSTRNTTACSAAASREAFDGILRLRVFP